MAEPPDIARWKVSACSGLGEQVEYRLAVGKRDGVLAGANAVSHMDIGAHRRLVAEHHCHIAHGARRVGPEQRAERSQSELAARLLPEHVEASQHAHYPVERRRVRTHLRCQHVCGNWLIAHVIGDAESCERRQRGRELLGEEELRHDRLRRDFGLLKRIVHFFLTHRIWRESPVWSV
jgi:hypothetical protein